MIRYRDWAPTSFDPKGLLLADRQDWIVVPVLRTRDSGALEQSNFEAACMILGYPEREDVEVHNFGHWGPGWFEIILVHPSREADVRGIAERLENYPVLDEWDFSQREHEAATEYWQFMTLGERIELCREENVSVFSARRDHIPDGLYDRVHAWTSS